MLHLVLQALLAALLGALFSALGFLVYRHNLSLGPHHGDGTLVLALHDEEEGLRAEPPAIYLHDRILIWSVDGNERYEYARLNDESLDRLRAAFFPSSRIRSPISPPARHKAAIWCSYRGRELCLSSSHKEFRRLAEALRREVPETGRPYQESPERGFQSFASRTFAVGIR